ncbi:MAG: hypothetical protein MUF75_06515 [Bacteroidia bacterium]|jgi:hypothetical protein|nr:hypothetical protein [Bacteroidia bacterium]
MKKRVILLLLSIVSLGWSQVGPGTWKDQLSLNACFSVARLGTTIYAANYTGLYYLDEVERSPMALNKFNGLSDVGPKLLRANPYNNKLLVIYQTSNIDVIDLNNTVTNYPDMKLKTFNGKKTINEVTFQKNFAYLACGFGIVLFDTERLEIKDTYIIGPQGSQLEVYQVALNDSMIYAATPDGLYKANYLKTSLNNFNNWKMDTLQIPKGPYCGVSLVDSKIVSVYSPFKLDNNIKGKDTIYVLENNVWSKFQATATSSNTIVRMGPVYNQYFSVQDLNGVLVKSVITGESLNYITSFNGGPMDIKDFYFGKDSQTNISYWVADYINGLFHTYSYFPFYPQDKIITNGINRSFLSTVDVFEGQVGVSPSHPQDAGGTIYTDQGLNIMRKQEWTYLSPKDLSGNTILDITFVYFDRIDKKRVWASSWYSGLLEYRNDTLIKVYNSSNTTMPQILPGNPRCTGLGMDSKGNLWLANSDVKNFLSVLKPNGQFINYSMDAPKFTRRILVDQNDNVWAIHERDGGITVFNTNTLTYKVLTKAVGNGNLGSNAIYSIAEDKSGKIWVGTSEGIRVFYNPSAVFNSSNFDAQPIKVVEDGIVELLLGNDVVTAITVDGADNKWVGTKSGGVFCFSPDGITQLYHFTIDNSPLYSNSVLDLNYDEVSGDVFIATDLGLQTYRSSIIAGSADYENVFAYPNPVRPGFAGKVYIRGLIDNSVVKIVDESGNLVWENKSTGGQLEWPVTMLNGQRVVSGVYVVYAATPDGEQRVVTKVLVMN